MITNNYIYWNQMNKWTASISLGNSYWIYNKQATIHRKAFYYSLHNIRRPFWKLANNILKTATQLQSLNKKRKVQDTARLCTFQFLRTQLKKEQSIGHQLKSFMLALLCYSLFAWCHLHRPFLKRLDSALEAVVWQLCVLCV